MPNHPSQYIERRIAGRRVREHVLVAERALGHPLPPGAEVHHWNEDKADNAPGNLVICPDSDYHRLMHMRARALDACGNANWRRCPFCKTHDDPANMVFRTHRKSGRYFHRACFNIWWNAWKARTGRTYTHQRTPAQKARRRANDVARKIAAQGVSEPGHERPREWIDEAARRGFTDEYMA